MSKQALSALVQEISTKTSREYRPSLNKEAQVVDLRATSIKTEITRELELRDPEFLQQLDEKVIGQAASIFRAQLNGLLNKYIKGDTLIVQGLADSYRIISAALTQASRKAIEYMESSVRQNSKLDADSLIQFDHTRPVSDTRIAASLLNTRRSGSILSELKARSYIIDEDYDVITEVISYYTKDGAKVFQIGSKVQGELRSGAQNQLEGTSDITKRKGRILKALQKAVLDVTWPTQKGSDSKLDEVRKRLNNAAVKSGATGIKQIIDTSPNTASQTNKVTSKTTAKPIQSFTLDATLPQKSNFDFASLVQYLNSRLAPVIRSRMVGSALHNQTGVFSESVKIVNVGQTTQGYPALEYTYQRSPYDVFDPVLGAAPWNTPGRDPKKLIEASIREIAKNIAIKRFYVRRA
jgi:hypothetical protein